MVGFQTLINTVSSNALLAGFGVNLLLLYNEAVIIIVDKHDGGQSKGDVLTQQSVNKVLSWLLFMQFAL